MTQLAVSATAIAAIVSGCVGHAQGPHAGASSADADAGPQARTACTAQEADLATFESGAAWWACIQSACAGELAACTVECACDKPLVADLQCVADGGPGARCFGAVEVAGKMGLAVASCMVRNLSTCDNGWIGYPQLAEDALSCLVSHADACADGADGGAARDAGE